MGLAPERCSRVACRYRSENLQDGFLYRGDVVADFADRNWFGSKEECETAS